MILINVLQDGSRFLEWFGGENLIAKLNTTDLHISGKVQSTLLILKTKGFSEILRGIRTSTYQICRNAEKNNQIIQISQ